MKKIALIITLLIFLSLSFSTNAETEKRLEDLRYQEVRIEQTRKIISLLTDRIEKSGQKESIENTLNQVTEKINSIEERINNKIKEKEENRRLKTREEMIRSIKEVMDNRMKEKSKDGEQQEREMTIEEMIREVIQKRRDKEHSKEEVEIRTKECGWCGCNCVEIYPEQICPLILCINYKYNCVYEEGECVLKKKENGGLLEGDISLETIPPYYPPEETIQEEITIEIDAFSDKERLYGMTEEEYRQQLEEETKRREKEGIK